MAQLDSMPTAEGRFQDLKARHHSLEKEIHQLQQCPSSGDILKNLKRAKLRIKEEIEGIRQAS